MVKRSCPRDGSIMHRTTRPLALACNGLSETFPEIEGWYCDKCDEAVYDPKDSEKISRLWNGLRSQASGILEPKEICRIRKKLGLTQKRAGILIGGGPSAFQKYEIGDVLPSYAVDLWLRRLDRDPSQLAFLEAHEASIMRKMYARSTSRKTVHT